MMDTPKHESDTTSVPLMTMSALGIVALLFGGIGLVALGYGFLIPKSPLVSADSEAARQLMTPGVEPNQAFERQRLQAEQRAILAESRWLDEEHKIARIPIDRAIHIMAERELQTDWTSSEPAAKPNSTDAESKHLQQQEQP